MRILFLLAMCMFMYCDEDPNAYASDKDKFFRGTHPLETLSSIPDSGRASMYTPAHDIYLEVDAKANTARFIFKNNNNEYMTAILPYDIMRFQFLPEDAFDQPYCKFRWMTDRGFCVGQWKEEVVYFVIGIKKSQIQGK